MDIPQYALENTAGNTAGTICLFPNDIDNGYYNSPYQFPTLKDLQLAYGHDVMRAQPMQGVSSIPKANEYTTNGESSDQYIHRETKTSSEARSFAETARRDNARQQKDSSYDKYGEVMLPNCGVDGKGANIPVPLAERATYYGT
ncbi:hypothetical protein Asppvi_010894 [Aspergillus pseudoviridinutans]|uniref:Uncharacterized protein n=1 Tax=Aspergillus pseudoviridinutans TaxID=1517512 RepID=A0A9P3BQA2_9EURO|nr:uncharacterized protein Asppvi_010894 [Aspergillus pseudoviridinutans]GIJ91919.1 hypothetical protein Asppvi_010894 [Aspergillus pseudoviridinutans]